MTDSRPEPVDQERGVTTVLTVAFRSRDESGQDRGERMENTLIVLVTALAFLAGGLTATMAATWWSRHRHDEVRREPPREDAACQRRNTCCCTAAHR
jgi:hypothetical protein